VAPATPGNQESSSSSDEESEDTWVCCDECEAWHVLPEGIATPADDVPWLCNLCDFKEWKESRRIDVTDTRNPVPISNNAKSTASQGEQTLDQTPYKPDVVASENDEDGYPEWPGSYSQEVDTAETGAYKSGGSEDEYPEDLQKEYLEAYARKIAKEYPDQLASDQKKIKEQTLMRRREIYALQTAEAYAGESAKEKYPEEILQSTEADAMAVSAGGLQLWRSNGSKSGFTGVDFHENKWRVRIRQNRGRGDAKALPRITIGRFNTVIEAAQAYAEYIELHPEFRGGLNNQGSGGSGDWIKQQNKNLRETASFKEKKGEEEKRREKRRRDEFAENLATLRAKKARLEALSVPLYNTAKPKADSNNTESGGLGGSSSGGISGSWAGSSLVGVSSLDPGICEHRRIRMFCVDCRKGS